MITIDPQELQLLQSRSGVVARDLMWLSPKNRATGQIEPVGLWTGDDHQTFTIDGAARLYFGAGGLTDLDAVESAIGLDVRMLSARLSGLAPETVQAVRGYDLRLAPVEVHRAVFTLDSRVLIAAPRRVFRGWVDSAEITTPAEGGEATVTLQLASAARAFTRPLALFRSDAAQRLRSPTDRFREYASTAGLREVRWGEADVRAVPSPTAPPGADDATSGNGRNDIEGFHV